MGSRLGAGLFCALALSAAGCFETRQIVTLNPDGSGKVVMDTLMASQAMMMMAATSKESAPDPNEIARGMACGMVTRSTGIDAWSDVKYEVIKDGRVHITGTAYFPDYAKIRIEGPSIMQATWTKADNGMVLEVQMNAKGAGAAKADPPPKALTDKEVEDLLKQKRQEWQVSRPMMGKIFDTLKMDTTFLLPGKVAEASIFEKADGGVRLTIEGKKVMAAMDKVIGDDKLMTEAIRTGKDPVKDGPGASDAMGEMIFGGKGPIRAKVGGDLKPLFDYQAEVAKAKAAQPAMLKSLGVEAPVAGK
jgi:hypothetical protein